MPGGRGQALLHPRTGEVPDPLHAGSGMREALVS